MLVMVLGASGFAGGAITRRLAERGDRVRAVVRSREAADRLTRHDQVEPVVASLGDPRALAAAAEGADAAVCAAGIAVAGAAKRALRWTHVAGSENAMKACRYARVPRVVFLSCADVSLHDADRVHWNEERHVPGRPFGDRARTLLLAEEVALSAALPTMAVVALRPAWLWGPGDRSRLPGLVREGLDGGIRLVGDGTTYFATTYIDHLVDATLSALTAEDVSGLAFQIADPTFDHARDFFGSLSRHLELPPPRSTLPRAIQWPLARLGLGRLTAPEVLMRGRSTLFDFNNAIGKLGYTPEVPTEEGLTRLRAWVDELGGTAEVARLFRAPPGADSVEAQVAAAGGD